VGEIACGERGGDSLRVGEVGRVGVLLMVVVVVWRGRRLVGRGMVLRMLLRMLLLRVLVLQGMVMVLLMEMEVRGIVQQELMVAGREGEGRGWGMVREQMEERVWGCGRGSERQRVSIGVGRAEPESSGGGRGRGSGVVGAGRRWRGRGRGEPRGGVRAAGRAVAGPGPPRHHRMERSVRRGPQQARDQVPARVVQLAPRPRSWSLLGC
jgi:hypothetical protein